MHAPLALGTAEKTGSLCRSLNRSRSSAAGAALLITQQSSIFTGLMTRTYSFIDDLSQPDIWVMDPKVRFIDDIKPLQDTELLRVRGVKGG